MAGERASSRFYGELAEHSSDPAAKEFLTGLAHEEAAHERAIAEFAQREYPAALTAAPLPGWRHLETALDWDSDSDLTLADALVLALEAEHHAALHYETLADALDGEPREFFLRLARSELEHGRELEQGIVRLRADPHAQGWRSGTHATSYPPPSVESEPAPPHVSPTVQRKSG
jgi:rubrerythrin